MKKYTFKFIDLFAGLGGFHRALESLGGKCVFASELKEDLQKLYKINYPGTPIFGDITKIAPSDIPSFDILCAGFPCQPFSQAGKRQGFNDEKDRGNLFYYICAILKEHTPRYVLLENVSNLMGHDNGNTWRVIKEELENLGYSVEARILSPHEFGIPQHRKRIYIVCQHNNFGGLDGFEFPEGKESDNCHISTVIDENDTDVIQLKEETRNQLAVWQEFIDQTIAHGDSIPTFPVWAMEFGATYDYTDTCPAYQTLTSLKGKRGKLGSPIDGNTKEECISQIPVYAQTDKDMVFPAWKIRYIQQNRAFYVKHKSWLDSWLTKVSDFDNSHLKFEWNCGKGATLTITDKIVQFRASGIRVKLPTFSPALNLVGTQVPILPWIKIPGKDKIGRYMTLKEAAAIQGMRDINFKDETFSLPLSRCYEALGNAVNVDLVRLIAKALITYGI